MRKNVMTAMLALACGAVQADVSVVGVLKEKALLSVDGGPGKVYPVGATLPDGSRLVAVSGNGVTLEENGKRYSVQLGQFANAAPSMGAPKLVFYADPNGHYVVPGEINGVLTRMMIDTGATTVAIPGYEAKRMGIDYRLKGTRAFVQTAGGKQEAWVVKVDKLKISDVEVNNIELIGSLQHLLEHHDVRRNGVVTTAQPQRTRRSGNKSG